MVFGQDVMRELTSNPAVLTIIGMLILAVAIVRVSTVFLESKRIPERMTIVHEVRFMDSIPLDVSHDVRVRQEPRL